MRMLATLTLAAVLTVTLAAGNLYPPKFPDARGILQRHFAAVESKKIEEAMQFFTPEANISVSDYECNQGMNVSEAKRYFNASTKWYDLMHRPLGTVVQNENAFAATFVDAGFIPKESREGGSWNFFFGGIVHGVINSFGLIEALNMRVSFMNETERSRYADLVNAAFAAECGGSESAFLDLFAPNATLLYDVIGFYPNGSWEFKIKPTTPEKVASSIPERTRCAYMVHQVVAGCGQVLSHSTKMWEDASGRQILTTGFAMMEFTIAGKLTTWDVLGQDYRGTLN